MVALIAHEWCCARYKSSLRTIQQQIIGLQPVTAQNLYNKALYVVRQAFIHEDVYILSIDMGADDDLVITPDRELSDIVIQGNEILIGKRHFVLKLAECA